MNIFRAMIFSSIDKAEAFEFQVVAFSIGPGRKRHRLLASHYSGDPLMNESDTFTLQIFQVTYPDAQEGKGWGEPRIAEKPHKTIQIVSKEKFLKYLEDYEISLDNWQPVESETVS